MIQKIKTFTTVGLEGFEITIESDSSKSLPNIEIIGLPDMAIKEAKERIRSTFRNSNIQLPNRKFILNLSPSDIRKVWTSFDLPMALSLLLLVYEDKYDKSLDIEKTLFFWELWLDGQVKRVNGLLPCVLSAIKKGYNNFFIPQSNIYELEYIPNINIYPISEFSQIIDHFIYSKYIVPFFQNKDISELYTLTWNIKQDFQHIKWQLFAKRVLLIAASWLHNLLMVWSPGSGKTMMAQALQNILPPLGYWEILDVSQIYSIVGKLNKDNPLIINRPFRQVHHTASKISIIWWGKNLTPWEVSLAHKWILFFDEITEFPRETLEVLRQPIEDKVINISRVTGTVAYPSNFMFVASMNPCKCWYYQDREKPCICSINEIKKYQSKISWPLMDRIDLILEIPRENIDNLLDKIQWESSEEIQKRVINAWKIQQARFKGTNISSNADMSSKDIDTYIELNKESKDFLSQISHKFILSPRVVHRLIKLSRTIADMNQEENVLVKHLAEAVQYRNKKMFIENE